MLEAAARALEYCSLAKDVALSRVPWDVPKRASLTAFVTSAYRSPASLITLCIFSEYVEPSLWSTMSSSIGPVALAFSAIAPAKIFFEAADTTELTEDEAASATLPAGKLELSAAPLLEVSEMAEVSESRTDAADSLPASVAELADSETILAALLTNEDAISSGPLLVSPRIVEKVSFAASVAFERMDSAVPCSMPTAAEAARGSHRGRFRQP